MDRQTDDVMRPMRPIADHKIEFMHPFIDDYDDEDDDDDDDDDDDNDK